MVFSNYKQEIVAELNNSQPQCTTTALIVCKSIHFDDDASILVHKRMFYIRTNLRMLQHSNVECNIRMLILCNKMMYFGDFVVLVACISSLSPNKHEYLTVFI